MKVTAASKGIDALLKARRLAYEVPGSNITNQIDTLIRSVYHWQDAGGRHCKLYECGCQENAMEFASLVSTHMRYSAIQGHSQMWSEGRIFIEFYGPHHSTLGAEIDQIHQDVCGD